MKVVFPTCCGVNVHKKFLAATITRTPKDSVHLKQQQLTKAVKQTTRFLEN